MTTRSRRSHSARSNSAPYRPDAPHCPGGHSAHQRQLRPQGRHCSATGSFFSIMLSMPNNRAVIGDVYWVDARATEYPIRVGKPARPMGCVAEQPRDPVAWTAIPRLSSGIMSTDVPSRAMPEISPTRLEREGAWSVRWIHSVNKTDTGKMGRCEYLGALPTDERQKMMDLYRNRSKRCR